MILTHIIVASALHAKKSILERVDETCPGKLNCFPDFFLLLLWQESQVTKKSCDEDIFILTSICRAYFVPQRLYLFDLDLFCHRKTFDFLFVFLSRNESGNAWCRTGRIGQKISLVHSFHIRNSLHNVNCPNHHDDGNF